MLRPAAPQKDPSLDTSLDTPFAHCQILKKIIKSEPMKASDFATQLRDEVIKLTLAGQKSLTTKNLTHFLDNKIGELRTAEVNSTQVVVDLQVSYYKAKNAAALEMFASVLDYGKHALNAAMLINAGAAVALLSFVGNLASHSNDGAVAALGPALLKFVLGVLLAAMASGGAYFTQYYYSQDEGSPWGKRFHVMTVLLALSSYVLFFLGALNSYCFLTKFGTH